MPILHRFQTDPHTCDYLPDRMAALEYAHAPGLAGEEYEQLLEQGYRKFGSVLFHPVCDGCRECRPLRVPAAKFRPNRSQRRAQQRNGDLRVEFNRPTVDNQRLRLYHRYHLFQTLQKDWPRKKTARDEYSFSFLQNPVPAVEISVWQEEALRAVVLTETTPNILSAIYHYYDPDLKDRSLGVFSLLQLFNLAKSLGKEWVHLGYYVAGCGSMAYKANFQPCQILVDGVWKEI